MDNSSNSGSERWRRPDSDWNRNPIKGKDHICYSARTCLLLPFQWARPTEANMKKWLNSILSRKVVNSLGEIDLWEERTLLPHQLADLDPHFRQTLGWDEHAQEAKRRRKKAKVQPTDDVDDEAEEDVCSRIQLTPEALGTLFPSPSLVAKASTQVAPDKTPFYFAPAPVESGEGMGDDATSKRVLNQNRTIFKPVVVDKVEVVVLPLGTAVLIFYVNWLCDRGTKGQPFTIEDLRTWLFLSKNRHKVLDVFDGWILNDNPTGAVPQTNLFGKHMERALFYSKPSSLSQIGNWLLSSPEERTVFFGRFSKRAYHHTIVVLDRQPSDQQLREYLFHLRRAFGQSNRPAPSENDLLTGADTILRPRLNRYIALSREGTVSLSWPLDKDPLNDFEIKKWHRRFNGIYLILAAHVQGEKSILLELADLSAESAGLLKLLKRKRTTNRDPVESKKINEAEGGIVDYFARDNLFQLATLMTRYTLQMSSDDCGGLSEYLEFFSALRKIFRIREQRSELRDEIQDVLALVESSYLEEQRKDMVETALVKAAQKRLERQRDKRKERTQRRFEKVIAIFSSVTLPLVVAGAIFGMNLRDLPETVNFWPMIGITLAIGLVIAVAFFLIPKPRKSKDEKKAKFKYEELLAKVTQKYETQKKNQTGSSQRYDNSDDDILSRLAQSELLPYAFHNQF